MAQRLNNFITKLRGIERNAHFKLVNIVNQNKKFIEDANRERLGEGKLTDGSDITNLRTYESTYSTSRYSALHTDSRKKKGKQTDFVDLDYSGKFYKSIKYKKTDDGGKIITTDPDRTKIFDIDDRYGDKVLGLTEDELDNLAVDAAQRLAEFIAQKISD